MIFDDRQHECRLDHYQSNECPKERPSCNQYVANACPWPFSMPKEVWQRSWEPRYWVLRNVWVEMSVDIVMPILGLWYKHLVLCL